jgi:hypothetical protein
LRCDKRGAKRARSQDQGAEEVVVVSSVACDGDKGLMCHITLVCVYGMQHNGKKRNKASNKIVKHRIRK